MKRFCPIEAGRNPARCSLPCLERWSLRIATLLFAALIPGAFARGGEGKKLDVITDNVRSQEALYANLEVVWRYSIRKEKDWKGPPIITDVADATYRSIRQNGLEYVNVEGSVKSADGKAMDPHFILGYDGVVTRSFRTEGAIANIQQRHMRTSRHFTPHMVLLEPQGYIYPLSTFLQGDAAIRGYLTAYPGGRDPRYRIVISYVGDEDEGGMLCHKIAVDYLDPEAGRKRPVSRSLLWLAPQRNYLPLKKEGYNPRNDSATLPVDIAVVKDMREIAPGIWFPFVTEFTIYSQSAVRENRLEVTQRKRFAVEKVSLNPEYPISQFRNIEFPENAAVYTVDPEGNIINTYHRGAPLDPTSPPRKKTLRWWLLAELALVVLGGAYYAWRTYLRA